MSDAGAIREITDRKVYSEIQPFLISKAKEGLYEVEVKRLDKDLIRILRYKGFEVTEMDEDCNHSSSCSCGSFIRISWST